VNCYPFIKAEKAQQHGVKRACQLLKVSQAAIYARLAARPGGPGPTRTSPARPGPSTRSPEAGTAPLGCTLSCAAKDTAAAASGLPG
jgi:hypothetical protein